MSRFNYNRFTKLLKKDFTENIKFVLQAIFIALFILFVLLSLEILFSSIQIVNLRKSLLIYYYISLFVLGAGISGLAFPAFRKSEKAINYLTLPASALEKFLSFLLLTSVGFLIVYTLIFIIFDVGAIFIFNIRYPEYSQEYFSMHWRHIPETLPVYFILNAIFLFGAATFSRFQHFFTVFIFLLASLGSFAIVTSVIMLYRYVTLNESNMNLGSLEMANTIKHIIIYCLIVFLWFISYLKLKEKEI